MYTVVTTCSAEQWIEYGERMVKTFFEHWPESVNLIVYGDAEYKPNISGLEWRRMPAWHDDFKLNHALTDGAHGMASGVYNYRRDCVRFSHKVAALTDVNHSYNGVIIWIDADTFTDRDIPHYMLKRWLPDGYDMSWLERRGTYPECGFMMFRNCGVLFQSLRNQYETGRVFDYVETHDSYVIQQTVKHYNLRAYNLSGPKSTRSHPWINSEIGQYMDHLKGKRKVQGFSHERNV